MSILSTHLWGKRRTVTPLSPVGERVARLRLARDHEFLRLFMAVYMLGPVIWGGSIMLATHVIGARLFAPGGGQTPLVVRVFDALSSVTLGEYGFMAGAVIFVLWGIPALARRQFDRSPQWRSVETRAKQRRMRRFTPWFVAGIVILYVGLGVLATVMTRWMVGLAITSKFLSMAGAYLIATAVAARHGTRLVCAKCAYPMGSWRAALPLCPECGRDWRKPWGVMIGSRRLDRRRLWAGVGLLALAAACASTGIWGLLRM